jgi:hypothetical protein
MLLREILSTHQQHSRAPALSKNLGDGFLLAHNPVFRNIRQALVKAGFKVTSRRFHDYDALSLTQLPKILKEKTIPYLDNVTPLKEIEKLAPGAFGFDEVPPLKANYIFHEGAHAVAHQLKPRALALTLSKKSSLAKKNSRVTELRRQQIVILNSLLEESFSNTCECLANLDANSEIHDEFLFKNSYIMEKPKDRVLLHAAENTLGRPALFRLMLVAYLHSNFIKTNTALENFDRVLKWVFLPNPAARKKLKPAQISQLKKTFQIGLNLDPGFTNFTNAFCFRLMGIEENIYDFLAFDFLEHLEQGRHYQAWIKSLTDVVCAR